MHNDITPTQQAKLIETIKPFKNCSLEFINTQGLFDDIWENVTSKNHFAKEVFYKLIPASFFPQYDKIIISDVDVVFLNDVSESFLAFEVEAPFYLAGIKANNPDDIFPLNGWKQGYQNFSPKEFEAIQYGVGAGYLIANLKQIRKDNIEQKFLDYASKNASRLVLPEQDVLNIICYPHIYGLSFKHMIPHYAWERFGQNFEKLTPILYSKKALTEASLYPIQIHYAGNKKPWNYPDEPKSDVWFSYIVQTPFLQEYLKQLPNTIIGLYQKTLLSYRIKAYLKKNPLFFLKPSFYVKVCHKIKKFLAH